MKYDPAKHHRRSIRLKGYDYSSPGAYFITICTYQRDCLFGDVVDGVMQVTEFGSVVQHYWMQQPNHHPHLELDAFVVMPNHIHGILVLTDIPGRGDAFGQELSVSTIDNLPNASPLQPDGTQPGSIGAIVQNFKSVSARRINQIRSVAGTPVWQRNYYEHVIRGQVDRDRIREYICNNPLTWTQDQLHPENK